MSAFPDCCRSIGGAIAGRSSPCRGAASARVRAIGPLARAAFWECIAIPDIRVQCRELAMRLAADPAGNSAR